MSGPENNLQDDQQNEEELFVLTIAELVQAGDMHKAIIHIRAYRDYLNKPLLSLLRGYRNTYPLDVYADKADGILGD